MSTGVITKDMRHVDIPTLKQFGISNQETLDTAVADKVVEEFLNNYMSWKDVVGYMVSGEDGDRLYGAALYTYSANLCLSNHLSEDKVKLLQSELLDYERKVEYLYKFNEALYFSLVICLH